MSLKDKLDRENSDSNENFTLLEAGAFKEEGLSITCKDENQANSCDLVLNTPLSDEDLPELIDLLLKNQNIKDLSLENGHEFTELDALTQLPWLTELNLAYSGKIEETESTFDGAFINSMPSLQALDIAYTNQTMQAVNNWLLSNSTLKSLRINFVDTEEEKYAQFFENFAKNIFLENITLDDEGNDIIDERFENMLEHMMARNKLMNDKAVFFQILIYNYYAKELGVPYKDISQINFDNTRNEKTTAFYEIPNTNIFEIKSTLENYIVILHNLPKNLEVTEFLAQQLKESYNIKTAVSQPEQYTNPFTFLAPPKAPCEKLDKKRIQKEPESNQETKKNKFM